MATSSSSISSSQTIITSSSSDSSSQTNTTSSASVITSSSTSSLYGYLEAPTALAGETFPLQRKINLTWDWSTTDVHGDPVVPTGFVIERSLDGGTWEVVSYDVAPSERSYSDELTEEVAGNIFALGQSVSYRVRAYLIK